MQGMGVQAILTRVTARRTPTLLSVVVPVLNEEATLPEFHRRLTSALDGLPIEIVYVDDGSTDSTPDALTALRGADERVRPVRLSRNFGHQAALTAGLELARGDVVVTIDADLQDPPEVIPELLEAWEGGVDVVFAVRRERPGEPRLRRALIALFYGVFSRLAQIDYAHNSGDFRLLDRKAVEALRQLPERNRFLRGMSVWIGFHRGNVEYDRGVRFAGESNYPLRKLLRLATDAIISFSFVPLRMAAVLGAVMSIVAFAAIPVVIALRIAGEYVSGIASVHILILGVGGIQLLTLGIMGEYLARNYDEAKRRPIYILDPGPDG